MERGAVIMRKPKRRSPNLFKAILVVFVLGAIAAGVVKVSQVVQNRVDQRVEAAAIENLDRAQALAEEQKYEEATRLLQPILDRVKDPAIAPKARMLHAELEEKNGNPDAALESWRSAAQDFAGSPDQPAAALRYAKALEDRGRGDEALKVYEQVRDTAPPGYRAPALIALAAHHEKAGDSAAALELYAKVMNDADLHSEEWFHAAHAIGKENVRKIFSREPTEDSKFYRVEKGDTLTSIGIELNTTMGLLTRANSIEENTSLRLNQTLKYTPKDFSIVVERSTARIYLLDEGSVFQVYRCGLGKSTNPTTPGRYRIGNKEKNPTWFRPGGSPVPPGDPENELGTRWMPLIPEEEGLPTDLGIHGTIRPDSIGKFESMGCPRMLNEEVEELWDLVVRSTPVAIVDRWEAGAIG